MLARATSTWMSPLFGPTRYDARATTTPTTGAGQTTISPWKIDLHVDRITPIAGVH